MFHQLNNSFESQYLIFIEQMQKEDVYKTEIMKTLIKYISDDVTLSSEILRQLNQYLPVGLPGIFTQ